MVAHEDTRSRIAIIGTWFQNYYAELVVSLSFSLVMLKSLERITFHADVFTDFQIVVMCVYSLFMIAAIICMSNTAISRVELRKLTDRDQKEAQ